MLGFCVLVWICGEFGRFNSPRRKVFYFWYGKALNSLRCVMRNHTDFRLLMACSCFVKTFSRFANRHDTFGSSDINTVIFATLMDWYIVIIDFYSQKCDLINCHMRYSFDENEKKENDLARSLVAVVFVI